MSIKIDLLKELHLLVKALNKNYTFPSEDKFGVEGKYGVCKKIITKLTDYFFTIIESGTTSFENERLITQQKESCQLIKCFGPMFIDFDEYPHCSGRKSAIFEEHVNEDIKCEHGYVYSAGQRNMCKWVHEDTWERMNKCFPDENQINMCPTTVSCKECTYVQKHVNENDEKIDPPADSEQTFSSFSFTCF